MVSRNYTEAGWREDGRQAKAEGQKTRAEGVKKNKSEKRIKAVAVLG